MKEIFCALYFVIPVSLILYSLYDTLRKARKELMSLKQERENLKIEWQKVLIHDKPTAPTPQPPMRKQRGRKKALGL